MYTIFLLAGAIVSSSAFLDSLFITINNNCTNNEFVCRNNRCVENNKRCDNVNDCLDNSDEEDCDLFLCKEPKYFRCTNHRCISKSFVCDGENDCEDYSDEINCESFKTHMLQTNSSCERGQWMCTDKLCIPNDWVCNGEPDCLDGSDEGIGCSPQIECDGFKCKNNHCIVHEWRCDGHDDCHDNSDEIDCENHVDRQKCTLDQQKFLCANNLTCIDLKKVCDGRRDCSDNSDEGPNCKDSSMSCSKHSCSHTCVQLPTGPRCLCPKGYHNIDEKHCSDINECETYGICDQKCKNLPGSYECYCDHKYILQDDKVTCKVVGGEGLMMFSSKTEIRAYTLTSEIYFPVAKHLKQVVGVAYDGNNVYWTDIFSEHESIVRSLEDGSKRELLVTSGLGLPEDLAIDWLTGNIYFTDAEKQHIGVCNSEGTHCTVLINKDIRKPRAIALNVEDGDMYWTDWGKPAEIAYASMDGSNDKPFLTTDIHWPNGLTIDYPNSRLYWTDAKKMTLESIYLDGTDRRIVLEGIVKHPYSIAVFENKLYWSDWATHSIQMCDKFTGKNHHTIIKDNKEYIYGISIFHSALRKRLDNPCAFAICSDICLINGASYSCACPQNKELAPDKHTCKDKMKRQMLILGARNLLVHVEHQLLGKHDISSLPTSVKNVGALAYNSVNNTLYVSDLAIRKIISINLNDGNSKPLPIDTLGDITSMDFDPLGNNLYWCDQDKGTVEVMNLNTMSKKILLHDMHGEIPEAITLVVEEGVMFVALKKKDKREVHIDRLHMDGTGRTHAIESGLVGPISMYLDMELNRIFWADAGTGNIESTSIEGDDRHSFRMLTTTPVSITSLNTVIFWVTTKSRRIYWADKNSTTEYNKRITLDVPDDIDHMHITSVIPRSVPNSPCHHNNGNCSHLCLQSLKNTVCACPTGMYLSSDKHSCTKRAHCLENEFLCRLSNACILSSLKCNNHRDCPLGEDEEDCKKPNSCPVGYFQCTDGECIKEHERCDHHYDCRDKSDEHGCEQLDKDKNCPPKHFECGDKQCIAEKFVCDGFDDCSDDSDETNCLTTTCESTQFRCNSGACIPKSWECDNEFDCSDLSDEHTNCVSTKCSNDKFSCNNGNCIDKKLTCNEMDDCGDNSDESSCESGTIRGHCGPEEFACTSNTTICVLNSARCNGTSECPHHEDEKDCSNCNLEEFTCKNGKCIPFQWLCDNADDCGDKSDEDICGHTPNITGTDEHVNCEDGYRCKTGACIDVSLVCNGKHDCYDGSDEDGLCSSSCKGNNPCSHECVSTPVGPTCKCRKGFRLMGDGHSCVDINECEADAPVCSQLCINRDGGYLCDCFYEFLLRTDKQSCKAVGSPMSLIFTSDNQIRELSQQTRSLNIIYSEETPEITGIDVSVNSNYIYFSIKTAGTIHRINKNTQTREYIEHVGQPQKLALDWSTNNVYFFNAESNYKSISICNFDEKVCAKLIDVDVHRQVSALAVDPVNKVLFYSLTSWWVFNSPSFVIYKTSLDGTESHELVKNTAGYATGLTYDLYKKVLYYTNQHQGQIGSINYDGTRNEIMFTNLTRPSGLGFFENHLFTFSTKGYMTKCKLYDLKNCETFKLNSYNQELFAIAQESRQPVVENVCRNHTCSYLCVPTRTYFKCVCEDGTLISDKEKCPTKARESVDDRRPIKVYSVPLLVDESSKESTGSLVAGILIPLCLLIASVGTYCVIRRKNKGHFNVSSVRFLNPSYGLHVDESEKAILQPGLHEYTNPIDFDEDIESSRTNAFKKLNPMVNT